MTLLYLHKSILVREFWCPHIWKNSSWAGLYSRTRFVIVADFLEPTRPNVQRLSLSFTDACLSSSNVPNGLTARESVIDQSLNQLITKHFVCCFQPSRTMFKQERSLHKACRRRSIGKPPKESWQPRHLG